jgi:hypothetical protein
MIILRNEEIERRRQLEKNNDECQLLSIEDKEEEKPL